MKWVRLRTGKRRHDLTKPNMRQQCCAFTGHRPEKVIGSEAKIIVELRKEILKAIDNGYRIFLTGMSRGVDLWAADIVIELRRHNGDLKLICVIPFEGMEENWPVDWRKHYHLIRRHADSVQVLSDRYAPDVYQKRNQWLVDHSTRLIAVYNGSPSGTGNTIKYGQECRISIQLIEV